MIKTLILISTMFILCNSASGQQSPEGTPADANSELAQVDANSEPANSAGDMEVVEVEGTKEEKHCTTVANTGSRVRTKHCQTASEAKKQREASKAWLNNVKSKPQALTPGQKG